MLKVNILTFVALLGLAGCASEPIIPTPVPIATPVETTCKITPPPKPVCPPPVLAPPLYPAAQAVLACAKLRDGYEGKLEAAIKTCQ